MKKRLLKSYMAMRRTIGLSLTPALLLLAGCIVEPVADGQYRTTNDAPVVQQAQPISENFGATGRRVALVIGNANYSGSISPLANPANDADAVAASMRRVGFEVDLQIDASRDQMNKAILNFSNRLQEGDVGLFYYAGHAVQVDGRNFMIPTEANLEVSDTRQEELADYVELETVETKNILHRMANAKTRMSIVILDACRDNPFSSTRSITRGLAAPADTARGTFIAYATAPGKVAEDGNTKNSPYTSALVETIQTPGMQLENVFKKVREKVVAVTDGRQTPWENSSITGDFYFTPAKAEPVVVVQPAPEPEPEPAIIPEPVVPAVPPATVQAPAAKETRGSPSINTTFITP